MQKQIPFLYSPGCLNSTRYATEDRQAINLFIIITQENCPLEASQDSKKLEVIIGPPASPEASACNEDGTYILQYRI
ncbi:hypothetical protein EON65_14525 [archaeon]|nr:MAG: hypothetical protein EON65_14525 [archaeon]